MNGEKTKATGAGVIRERETAPDLLDILKELASIPKPLRGVVVDRVLTFAQGMAAMSRIKNAS